MLKSAPHPYLHPYPIPVPPPAPHFCSRKYTNVVQIIGRKKFKSSLRSSLGRHPQRQPEHHSRVLSRTPGGSVIRRFSTFAQISADLMADPRKSPSISCSASANRRLRAARKHRKLARIFSVGLIGTTSRKTGFWRFSTNYEPAKTDRCAGGIVPSCILHRIGYGLFWCCR